MKTFIYIWAFVVFNLYITSSSHAQDMGQYLPKPLTSTSDPRMVEAVNLLVSESQVERDKGLSLLNSLSNIPETASSALLTLAIIENGKKSKQAKKRALGHLKTCVQNDPTFSDCQIWLGIYHRYGSAGTIKKKTSSSAFQASADTGSPLGQWYLGMAYLRGIGVPKNEKPLLISF